MTATARQTSSGGWLIVIESERELRREAALALADETAAARRRGQMFVRWLWAVVCVFGALVAYAVSL